jgi:Ni,Fe-hydrogenase III large subunit
MTAVARTIRVRNAVAFLVKDCPVLGEREFHDEVVATVRNGAWIAALYGEGQPDGSVKLFAVMADDAAHELAITSTVVRDKYPSLTADLPQAQAFERDIAEVWRVRPVGHPWLKPLRFQAARRDAPDVLAPVDRKVGQSPFFSMLGEEIHEVAVGPVHAGVIEPGHFRFQCHGETVHHLEISLGYQHRGVTKALVGGPNKRTQHYIETLAGDTSIGHALAYAQASEGLSRGEVPGRAVRIRQIALELERLACHTGDLGALSGDVGFQPTDAFCGRLRGDVLNLTALICGNRFGRGLLRPGGTRHDLDDARIRKALDVLGAYAKDVRQAVDLLQSTASVLARFESVGVVSKELATEIGLVGPAARASGLTRDVRADFPTGAHLVRPYVPVTATTGDVAARAKVRALEIEKSLDLVRRELQAPWRDGLTWLEPGGLRPHEMIVSLTEAWRGAVCHVARTEATGHFACYQVIDPSVHNWFGLACALREQAISDFPLCNKSFNLSYCGHDL